jgi:ABC-type transport system involved in cytochrome c biogenesis permease component
MRLLPIVGRELLGAARRRSTYWSRMISAGSGLVVGGWIMLIPQLSPKDLGITLFTALTVVASVYCLFAGLFRTADCLSEEKREGTLGLLFLTDLKGYDIVLGKLVATSVNAFYGMLALFPILAIPLMLGGVTVEEFWRVVLASVNTMFFSMAIGIFASSISRDERRAIIFALVVALFFTAGCPLLAAVCARWTPQALSEYLLVPSPGYAVVMAFEAMQKPKAAAPQFYTSVLFTHGLSWLALIAASNIVPRTWQDKAENARPAGWFRRLWSGSAQQRVRRRGEWLTLNPILWLASRHQGKTILVWLLVAVGIVIWGLGLSFAPRWWKDEPVYIITALLAHSILKFWVGSEAARRFSLDRQSGALELILATPLPVREIVRGQRMALERQFGGALLVVLLADLLFMRASSGRQSEVVAFWMAVMLVLVADVVTLAWLGMWHGLNSHRPNRAAAAALWRVLLLPWIVFLLLCTLGALTHAFDHLRWEGFLFVGWAGVSVGLDLYFGLPAFRLLYERFREVAAGRFDAKAHHE